MCVNVHVTLLVLLKQILIKVMMRRGMFEATGVYLIFGPKHVTVCNYFMSGT